MANSEKKLTAFTSALVEAARAKAQAQEAAIREAEEKALSDYSSSQAAGARRAMAAGIASARVREDKRITAGKLRARRALLEYRESCADEVFAEVRRQLEEFPASPEYAETLAELLARAVSSVPGCEGSVIYLRPQDMGLAPELRASLPNAQLSFQEGSFALGGLVLLCPSLGRRVDLSFDSALEDVDGRFSELTGFNVEGRHDET